MDKNASDLDADTESDIGRAAAGFQRRLQRDAQSWLANESGASERRRSGASERRRDAALDLGIRRTEVTTGASKKLSKPTTPSAPAKLIEGKGRPFSMSYDGLTMAQYIENRHATKPTHLREAKPHSVAEMQPSARRKAFPS